MKMKWFLCMMVLVCCTMFVFAGKGRDDSHEDDDYYGHDTDGYYGGARGEAHYCTSHFNGVEKFCQDGVTSCERRNCPLTRRCSWWGRCRTTRICARCCEVTIKKPVHKTEQGCCPGYYGRRCEKPFCENICSDVTTTCTAPNKCGPACYPACAFGQCVETPGSSNNTCKCDRGFQGPTCSQRIRCDVTTDPCENGGTCNTWYGARCACPPGYTGARCEKQVICSPACQNGGTCSKNKCLCAPGFTGPTCDTKVVCNPLCLNGGTCRNGMCTCAPGFTGTTCATQVVCNPPCLNGGTCRNSMCTCAPGFTGTACATRNTPMP